MNLFERVTISELIEFCQTHNFIVIVNDGHIKKLERENAR